MAGRDPERITDRYVVERRLGAGAFGTVYLATDTTLGRKLAIKTVRMDALAATGAPVEELVERFAREARLSAQLRHPNIVTIYDVGDFEGLSFLAMEYIEGEGLESLIARAGRLPPARAIQIAAQVAQALGHAHSHGVVHRDVKPANIMIEAGDRVKVTDFGIAKAQSAETITATGSLVGTPAYMSPEQARGNPLDGRSDLFSLGCVLYEMLAGARAFQADSITGLIFKVITEPPPPLRELSPDTPPELAAIVQKALSKAPETRFPTGEAMAEVLLAAADSLPRAPVGTSPALDPTVVSRPARGATTSGAGSRASSTAPTVAARSGARRPAVRPPPPEPEEGGAGPVPWLLAAAAVVGLTYWTIRERAPQNDPTPAATQAAVATPEPSAPADAGAPRRVAIAPAPAFTPPPDPRARAADPAPSAAAPPPPRATGSSPPVEAARGPAGPPPTWTEAPQLGPGGGPPPPPGMGGPRGGLRGGGRGGGPGGDRLEQGERLAVGALTALAQSQGTFFQRNSRYGSLVQLQREGLVPATTSPQFQQLQRNYRLEIQAGRTTYRAVARAVTSGLRSFEVDETGVVRPR